MRVLLVLLALLPLSFALLSHVAEAASGTGPHRSGRLAGPSLPSSADSIDESGRVRKLPDTPWRPEGASGRGVFGGVHAEHGGGRSPLGNAALAPSRKLDVAVLVNDAERALLDGERPRIVPRTLWDESVSTSSGLYAYRGDLGRRFTHVVVHHSDLDPAPGPAAILRYHKDVSGFSDIGYHFVIEPNGRVYEGRDLRFMGAHAGYTVEQRRAGRSRDPDFGAIGVVLDGNFERSRPDDRQLRAAVALIEDLRRRFAIPRQNVIGHGEVTDHLVTQRGLTLGSSPTSCPGSELLKVLRSYRAVRDRARKSRAATG